jgi:hypothetical protein
MSTEAYGDKPFCGPVNVMYNPSYITFLLPIFRRVRSKIETFSSVALFDCLTSQNMVLAFFADAYQVATNRNLRKKNLLIFQTLA